MFTPVCKVSGPDVCEPYDQDEMSITMEWKGTLTVEDYRCHLGQGVYCAFRLMLNVGLGSGAMTPICGSFFAKKGRCGRSLPVIPQTS